MDLEIDIYISHLIDKENNFKYYQPWVDNFREYINWFIKKLIKRNLNIVSSSDLLKDDSISINFAIKNAKCILFILSPEYTDTIQYQNEIQLVMNQKSTNSSIKDKVFKVCKYPIDEVNIPQEIQESFNYNLFVLDSEKEVITEFNDFYGEIEENVFWFKIVDLCYDLYYQISGGNLPISSENKSVFLAEVSKDQIFHRDLIKRDFLMKGYQVYPNKHLIANSLNELEEDILNYISKCEFSIHIFGDEPGNNIDNTELSIVDFQNQVAAKYSQQTKNLNNRSPFYRFIWIPPNLKLYNQKQLARIENIKRNIREIENAEIIETPLEVFRSIVRSRIKEEDKSREEKIRKITNTNTHSIYIIFEFVEKKNKFIHELIQTFKSNNINVIEPDFGDDQRILINTHKKNLIEADSVFIYYKNSGNYWLRSKIQDIIKAPGYGKVKPFIGNCLFIESDNEENVETSKLQEFEIITYNENNKLEDYIRRMVNKHDG